MMRNVMAVFAERRLLLVVVVAVEKRRMVGCLEEHTTQILPVDILPHLNPALPSFYFLIYFHQGK